MGNAYHWAFVARVQLTEGFVAGWRTEPYVFLIAQDQRVVHKEAFKKLKHTLRCSSRFTVHICYTAEDAASMIGCNLKMDL